MKEPTHDTVELYKLAVEMADRVSARRGHANQFYLTLQSILLGAPALVQAVGSRGSIEPFLSFLLCVVGVVTSATWWLQLKSYRDLNKAKFAVINAIEEEYFEVRPFLDEWNQLKSDPIARWRPRYAELGTIERVVPVVFLLINLVLAVIVWI